MDIVGLSFLFLLWNGDDSVETAFRLGTILRATRMEQKISQRDMSADLCSLSMLSRIENNDCLPSTTLLQQLCERLDISTDFVLNLDYHLSQFNRNEWLDLMKYYYQGSQYDQLKRMFNEMTLLDEMTSIHEMQEYYLYQGCCTYFFQPNATDGLQILTDALNLTYCPEKEFITDIEIILLSEVGRIYLNSGDAKTGQEYTKKSLDAFYQHTPRRNETQLTKIFHNHAVTQIEMRNYSPALKTIEQGIRWSTRRKSYYYLDELFILKGLLLQDTYLINEGLRFSKTAASLRKMNDAKTDIGDAI